jgi:hypothetical protein
MIDLKIKAGKYDMKLSESFLTRQDAWGNIDNIKQLFYNKFELFTAMEETDDIELIQIFAEEVWENEKEIMKAFNFEVNKNFFKFWEMPRCSCAKMDNFDLLGTKYNIYSGDCIIHGTINNDNHSPYVNNSGDIGTD